MIKGFQPYVMNFNYPVHPMAVIFGFGIQDGDDSPDGSVVFPLQMEVDWIKIYKRKHCGGDVYISGETPYVLDSNPKVLNSVTGINVDISGNFVVASGHQVDVLAENSITLGAGFSVEEGAKFLADIVSPLCYSSENKRDEVGVDRLNIIEMDLKVFPNPSEGEFTIEVPKDFKKYEIKIVNLWGEVIYFSKSEQNVSFKISIGKRKGVYFVKVNDILSGKVLTRKIVVK
jgi:hypothetical protein